jgi:hypothetical protein
MFFKHLNLFTEITKKIVFIRDFQYFLFTKVFSPMPGSREGERREVQDWGILVA